MKKLLKLLGVAALCVSGLVGCGGTIEERPDEAPTTTAQGAYRGCVDDGTMAGACPTGYSCVNGTCYPRCSSSDTCPIGQKCCLGYMYVDESKMYPYCTSTSSLCYQPWN